MGSIPDCTLYILSSQNVAYKRTGQTALLLIHSLNTWSPKHQTVYGSMTESKITVNPRVLQYLRSTSGDDTTRRSGELDTKPSRKGRRSMKRPMILPVSRLKVINLILIPFPKFSEPKLTIYTTQYNPSIQASNFLGTPGQILHTSITSMTSLRIVDSLYAMYYYYKDHMMDIGNGILHALQESEDRGCTTMTCTNHKHYSPCTS